MKPSNNKIIVSVDFSQKEKISLGGNDFLLAKEYNKNRRESMPVICKTISGNKHIKNGTFLLVHHNRFGEFSPHHLGNNLYSLAYNEAIFAKLDEDGNAHSLCNNIIVEQIYDNDSHLIPEHLKVPNKFKYKVVSNGFGYKKGDMIFCYEFANYEMVYVFKGQEKRVIKVYKNDIVGILKK